MESDSRSNGRQVWTLPLFSSSELSLELVLLLSSRALCCLQPAKEKKKGKEKEKDGKDAKVGSVGAPPNPAAAPRPALSATTSQIPLASVLASSFPPSSSSSSSSS